jgi:hypothetical protein
VLTVAVIFVAFAAALFLRLLPTLNLPERRPGPDYPWVLLFAFGCALVAIPVIPIVEPTTRPWLPGLRGTLLLVAGGALATAVAAGLLAYGRSGAASSTSRMWSWLFAAGAVVLQAFTFIAVSRAAPGTFAGLGYVAGGILVAALWFAALVCAGHSYYAAAAPRSRARLVEVVSILVAGYILLLPAIHVLRM